MSIFKDTFRGYVRDQLSLREELIDIGNTDDSGNRTSRINFNGSLTLNQGTPRERTIESIDRGAFYNYALNKQCTLRLTSLVDYVEDVGLEIGKLEGNQSFARLKGASLSQNFILQGGVLTDFARANITSDLKEERIVRRLGEVRQSFPKPGLGTALGYGDPAIGAEASDDGYGIVPMPGIIDATIRTKSAYGSLREAKINFEVHNQRQLEIAEMLYMRPGYMVLLEWGWCPFINNNGEIVSNLRLVEDESGGAIYTNNITQPEVFTHINSLKESQNGNYDGLLAIVKNFGFQARPDGGYTCFTELISIGEVLESLKIPNISVFNPKIKGDLTNNQTTEGDIVVGNYDGLAQTTLNAQGLGNAASSINQEKFDEALSKGIFPNFNGLEGMIKALNNYVTFNSNTLNEYVDLNLEDKSGQEANESLGAVIDYLFPETNYRKSGLDQESAEYKAQQEKYEVIRTTAQGAGYGNRGGTQGPGPREYLRDLLRFQAESVHRDLLRSLQLTTPEDLKNFIIVRGGSSFVQNDNGRSVRQNNVQQAYIRWDALTILINQGLIPKDEKLETPLTIVCDKITKLNKETNRLDPLLYTPITDYRQGDSNLLMDFSCDPNVCILTNQFVLRQLEGFQYDYAGLKENLGYRPAINQIPIQYIAANYLTNGTTLYNEAPISLTNFSLNETDQSRRIGSIFLNIDMLMNIMDKNSDNVNYTVGNFVNDIWAEVNKVCPNHNFVLTDDKESNNIFIIDLPVDTSELPVDDLHTFIPFSNKNILRSFEYTSNVPSALTSTIAIQAQDPRSIQDIDGVTFAAFNRAIKNRILSTDITPNFTKTRNDIKNTSSVLMKEQEDLYTQIQNYLRNFFKNLRLKANDQETLGDGNIVGVLKTYQKNATYINTANTGVATNTSVIPLEFSATLDGISGIVIGNVFKIKKDRLPRAYKNANIGFIVFNEEQKITSGQDWTTDISGKMILLPNPNNKPLVDGTKVFTPGSIGEFNAQKDVKAQESETENIDPSQKVEAGMEEVRVNDPVYLKRLKINGLTEITEGAFSENLLKENSTYGFTFVRSTAAINNEGGGRGGFLDYEDNAIGCFNSAYTPEETPPTTAHGPGAAGIQLGVVTEIVKIEFPENTVAIKPDAYSLYLEEKNHNLDYQIKFTYEDIENINGVDYYVFQPKTIRDFPLVNGESIIISPRPLNEIGTDDIFNIIQGDKIVPEKFLIKVSDCSNINTVYYKIQFLPTAHDLFINGYVLRGNTRINTNGANDQLSSGEKLTQREEAYMRIDTLASSRDNALKTRVIHVSE